MKFLSISATAAVFFVLSGLFAGVPDGGGTAESLATAEKAFARESVEKGMRTAFLDALSDDGVILAPGSGAKNGKEIWQTKKDSAAVLDWQPVLAVVASGGDLGYTTGAWNYRRSPNEKSAAFGEFVSVWRREAGNWKLLCDVGSDHAAPSAPTPELKLIDLPHPSEAKPVQFSDLQKHDRDYATNRAKYFEALADENARLYQPGKFPALGKSAGVDVLKGESDSIAFGESKGAISRNGDLGILWGEYRVASATAATGDYLRIWRKDEQGGWKLMLDLLHPR